MTKLKDYQLQAINELKNGSILCGGVGSGKSITALAYYIYKECDGEFKCYEEVGGEWECLPFINSFFKPMKKPKDLYIITTAKKRDSLEWDKECANFVLSTNPDCIGNIWGVSVVVDSWNNIKKYKDIHGAFFIFDEQRVVGSGTWVKTFLNITRKNHWILLSATPGDKWSDYIPVFIANGFYKNKTEFNNMHCVFSRFTNYPRIERYINEDILIKNRDSILVRMKDNRTTKRHDIYEICEYNKDDYKTVFKYRWNIYDNEPIEETGKLLYLLRKVVNSDPSRIKIVDKILKENDRAIIFYNFNYELDILKDYLDSINYRYSEWNGQKHEDISDGKKWVYLVQYTAGCEGWNCITCNTIIFYSQNYSYRVTEQAKGRIDRINTCYTDLYYYMIRSTAPIDIAIYIALKNKKNFNERSFVKK